MTALPGALHQVQGDANGPPCQDTVASPAPALPRTFGRDLEDSFMVLAYIF